MARLPQCPLLAALVLLLATEARGLVCANEIGEGCNMWEPSQPEGDECRLHTVVHASQFLEARVPDLSDSTGYDLVARRSAAMRVLGNATIPPLRAHACLGCASTRVLFFEPLRTGMLSVVGRRPFGTPEHYDAFALGVEVLPAAAPVACAGGFVGYESDGRTLTVERNALVEVRLLASLPSTGYEWVADPATPAAAQAELPCRWAEHNRYGCQHTYVFFFRATHEGQVRVNKVKFGSVIRRTFVLNLRFPADESQPANATATA
eukprot:m51a1_g6072 hypothetical protein (264) ;mRNA; r:285656-286574